MGPIFTVSQMMLIDLLLLTSLVFLGVSYRKRRGLPLIEFRHYRPEYFREWTPPPEPVRIEIDVRGRFPLLMVVLGVIFLSSSVISSAAIDDVETVPPAFEYSNIYYFGGFPTGNGPGVGDTVTFHGVPTISPQRETVTAIESLHGAEYTNIVFSGIDMRNLTFVDCVFRNVEFRDCQLENTSFYSCRLDLVLFDDGTGGVEISGNSTGGPVLSGDYASYRVMYFSHMPVLVPPDAQIPPGDVIVRAKVVAAGSGTTGAEEAVILIADSIEPYEQEHFNTRAAGVTLSLAFVGIALAAYGLYAMERNGLLIGAVGWVIYGTFWLMYIPHFIEIGDAFNTVVVFLGVLLFVYMGTREMDNIKMGYDHHTMRWMAGAVFIGSAVYFALDKIPILSAFLIKVVADQSVFILNAMGYPSSTLHIDLAGNPWYYRINPADIRVPVKANGQVLISIILACTGIQAIVMYIASLVTLEAERKKKYFWAVYTTVLIYVTNLLRNAGIVWATTEEIWGPETFELAHNWVTKFMSLGLLIVITLMIFRDLPELYDNIMGLFDLPKRWVLLETAEKRAKKGDGTRDDDTPVGERQ